MKKIIFLSIFSLNLLFAQNEPTICDITFENNITLLNVPAAYTQERQAKGLSNKKSVGIGMIFVWEKPSIVSFWMKDTYIPLSIGFFDTNGELFQINDMEPHSKELHHSTKETIFALELPQGDFTRLSIKIGTKISKFACR